jgi:hypothetical protein
MIAAFALLLLLLTGTSASKARREVHFKEASSAPTASKARWGSSSLLKLRGGTISRDVDPLYKKIEMMNRVSEATSLINNLKVPAALFAGQSLASAFAKLDNEDSPSPPRTLDDAYRVFVFIALFSELTVVFTATTLNWRLLGGGFDPVAVSAPALLMKYFDFEYLSMVVLFLGGIVSLTVANALRTSCFFGTGRWLSTVMFSVSAWLVFYFTAMFHHSIVSFDRGLLGLLPHLAKRAGQVLKPMLVNASFAIYVLVVAAGLRAVRKICEHHAYAAATAAGYVEPPRRERSQPSSTPPTAA